MKNLTDAFKSGPIIIIIIRLKTTTIIPRGIINPSSDEDDFIPTITTTT